MGSGSTKESLLSTLQLFIFPNDWAMDTRVWFTSEIVALLPQKVYSNPLSILDLISFILGLKILLVTHWIISEVCVSLITDLWENSDLFPKIINYFKWTIEKDHLQKWVLPSNLSLKVTLVMKKNKIYFLRRKYVSHILCILKNCYFAVGESTMFFLSREINYVRQGVLMTYQ